MERDHPSSPLSLSTPSLESGPDYERDSTYKAKDKVQTTSADTPLKNKAFGNRSLSSASSSRLESNSFKPNICVLTGDTSTAGSDIEKAELIHHLTTKAELRKYEWLLGYTAGEFRIDSHHNIMYMEYGWHHQFDRYNWALVPDKPTRDVIVERLKEVVQKLREVVPKTSDGVALERKGGVSAWPHLEKVFSRKNKDYQYQFFNIALSGPTGVRDGKQTVDIDQELPLLPLESHIHPLYVIINAYPKIKDFKDGSESSLEVVAHICEIWKIWNSISAPLEFMQYDRKDSTNPSIMGPPPGTPSESRCSTRSSTGHDKHGDNSDNGDDDDADGAHKRSRGNGGCEGPSDAVPALDQSGSSRESSANPFNTDSLAHIRLWRDTVEEAHPPTAYPEDEAVATLDDEIGSPK
ncbi:hypothetical protein FIBSPDRAFT_1050854 [Athelia psychrophila]|uniref:HNH nuclease domain-containing protein n=1 Tax=Athelia psychrophila TaxID=1759441 RepID=A0A166A3F8_9AGAM|nr:hypothetical protein FIBSPDRAFT_1050854 [Fibularhizoctonia sp. CBS 109695]